MLDTVEGEESFDIPANIIENKEGFETTSDTTEWKGSFNGNSDSFGRDYYEEFTDLNKEIDNNQHMLDAMARLPKEINITEGNRESIHIHDTSIGMIDVDGNGNIVDDESIIDASKDISSCSPDDVAVNPYSYHWNGYETHEFPKVDEPKVLMKDAQGTFGDNNCSETEINLQAEELETTGNVDDVMLLEEKLSKQIEQTNDIESLRRLGNELQYSKSQDVNEQGEDADYSYHWTGYENHEFPEINYQNVLLKDNTVEKDSMDVFSETKEFHDTNLEGTDNIITKEAHSEMDELQRIAQEIGDSYEDIKNHQIRVLAQETRGFNKPIQGEKGLWEGSRFVLDDNYVPSERFNPEHRTMEEIKEDLKNNFAIDVSEIDYPDGQADFSSISVANVDSEEIVLRKENLKRDQWEQKSEAEKLSVMAKVFDKNARNTNFQIADKIAAEKHINIPGLGRDYSPSDLKQWRQDNRFTWDEQIGKGYNLVPSVIHSSLSHTGLVSNIRNATDNYNAYMENIDKYSFDEETAPISIEELEKLEKF